MMPAISLVCLACLLAALLAQRQTRDQFAHLLAVAVRASRRVRLRVPAPARSAAQRVQPGLQATYDALDRYVFPPVVSYFAHPLHITALLFLGVALMVYRDPTFELVAGNYTNIGSCLTAVILLYRQRKLEATQAAHTRAIANLHQTLHARHDEHTASLDEVRRLVLALTKHVDALAARSSTASTASTTPTAEPVAPTRARKRAPKTPQE